MEQNNETNSDNQQELHEEGPAQQPKPLFRRMEDFVMWSSLLVYFVVWGLTPMMLGVPEFAWTGWLLGAAYVAGHAYEIRYRGHCYLSADSTAMPLAVQAALLLYALLFFAFDASWSLLGKLGLSFAVSFGVGHVIALIYAAVMSGLISLFLSSQDDDR